MWYLISIHLERVLLSVQDKVYGLRQMYHSSETFWMHPMVLLGDKAQVETRFGLFGDSVRVGAI